MGKMNRSPTKVWRISENAPMGEWVDMTAPPRIRRPQPLPSPETDEQGVWVRSSFDLLDGVDIRDDGEDVSDEVFKELFGDDKPG